MSDLTDKLKQRLAFDGSIARAAFWQNTDNQIAYDPKANAHSFECGAEWDANRTAPLVALLISAIEELERLASIKCYRMDASDSATAMFIAQKALSRLRKELGE